MAALIAACKVKDGVERSTNVDDIARTYRHLENCDPQTDMLFAEVDGQVIAYGRIWWDDLLEGIRLYHPFGFLHPDWRGKGIGNAMLEAAELRAREIAAGHPKETPKFLQVEPLESEKDLIALLERRGYRPVRYETHMVRDLAEPFPEAPMPAGLEVRPVKPEHLRHIFEASNEAFRDHWGIRDMSEEEYKSAIGKPGTTIPNSGRSPGMATRWPAWSTILLTRKKTRNTSASAATPKGICTRRPWRKLGLARSLLVQSMQMFKEMGMTETALSVDSENLSGAFRLYEGVGYRKVKQQIIYRKPME